MALIDGLGGEELGQAGSQPSNVWITGSLTSQSQISGANVYAGTNVEATDVEASNNVVIGSSAYIPFNDSEGVIINNVPAEAIITGGMWVEISGASGASPSFVAKGTEEPQPAGICLATTASGANPEILTRGPYKGIIAEATLSVGDGFAVGAGNALNCAKAAGAGLVRGSVIMGGGSEAEIAVWLW